MEDNVFDKEYTIKRFNQFDLVYRINKRIDMVKRVLNENFKDFSKLSILDVGCADGIILDRLNQQYYFKRICGIDISQELINLSLFNGIEAYVGDANQKLDFQDSEFDVILNTTVIEHIDNKRNMINEFYRILKLNGIVIMTEASPFYCKVGIKLKYFRNVENTLTMEEMDRLFINSGFSVIKKRYFGLNPFFEIPFEYQIEGLINKLKLGRLISNQLIVAKKKQRKGYC